MPDGAYSYAPRVLRSAEAARYVGMSESAFLAHDRKPDPIALGPKARGYLREDLDAMVDRLAGRAPASEEDYADGH